MITGGSRCAVVVAMLMASTVVPTATDTVVAAQELRWYSPGPGFVRTDLETTVIAADADRDLVYAATRSNGRTGITVVDAGGHVIRAAQEVSDDIIVDLDVSKDGRTVYALTADSAIRIAAATLQVADVVELQVEATTIIASPDEPARFMTIGELSGSHRVYDGADVMPDGTASIVGQHAIFGRDGDSLFTVDFGNDLHSIDLTSGSLQLVESTSLGRRVIDIAHDVDRVVAVVDWFGPDFAVRGYDESDLRADETVDATFEELRDDRLSLLDTVNDRFIQGTGAAFVQNGFRAADAPRSWILRVGSHEYEPLRSGRLALTEFWSADDGTSGAYLAFVDPGLVGSAHGHFHPTTPVRVLDTRDTIGVASARPVGPDSTIDVQIAGRRGLPESGVLAVAMNITVTNPTAASFVSVWPSGLPRPNVSNVNFVEGRTIANYATVPVGPDGAVQLYNGFGNVDVIFDVVGYYTDESGERGATYETIRARRVLDTRESTFERPAGRVRAGDVIEVHLDELEVLGDAPERSMVAVAVNVTAILPSRAGFLTVYPGDARRPTASTVNFAPGDVRANMVVTGISPDGTFKIYSPFGEVDVVVDLFGVYSVHEGSWPWKGRLVPLRPFRSFDSRVSSPFGGSGALEPASALIVPNAQDETAVINLTAASTTADGFLSVVGHRRGDLLPSDLPTSNVNFRAGEVVANAAFMTGEPDNAIINPFGSTHVVIDVFAYMTPFQLRSAREVWGP